MTRLSRCWRDLGQTSAQYPGLTPDELLGRSLGLNFPILSGLITLTSTGLLYGGEPEKAYRQAFRTAFFDIGYAREAVGLLAAALSIAISQEVTAVDLFDRVLAMDPLSLGGEFSAPFVKQNLAEAYSLVEGFDSDDPLADRALARQLSLAFADYNTFDPFRTLGVAFLTVLAADADPMRAMLIAVNHLSYGDGGQPVRFEDIDCYAGIAGALAGAVNGVEALPANLATQVVESNKLVHGIDLIDTIDRFMACFYR